ncbi:hypothetical protein HPB50_003797 [Hyalomma asiaticum]|uniref:Uncharacterized protein n=1 Tax=Hyalomma asiaticum TaxID=266040 RepID=A0ACB7S407_HYAAI|nr:hypothetical protein HPB50_003797 [Hyalomma asiaticum]
MPEESPDLSVLALCKRSTAGAENTGGVRKDSSEKRVDSARRAPLIRAFGFLRTGRFVFLADHLRCSTFDDNRDVFGLACRTPVTANSMVSAQRVA